MRPFASLALAALFAAGCSGSSTSPGTADGGCQATFAGNFAETDRVEGCAAVGVQTDGGSDTWLSLTVTSSRFDRPESIAIDLGAAPEVGSASSESVSDWSAVAIQASGCELSAGTASVPVGSFTLALSSVDATSAHGTLQLTQYIQAPPGTDCGAGDTETLTLDF